MQAQIQALLAGGAVVRGGGETTKVVKSQIFDGTLSKVAGFISACKLYIRIKLREESVEGQVQWILSYVQGGTADVWKENVIEELEGGEVEYETAEKFLSSNQRQRERVAERRRLEYGEGRIKGNYE